MQQRVLRELVFGLWKIHILHHAAEEGVIGNHLLHELRAHGHDVSPGTLYPVLHRMESTGLVRCDSHPDSPHAARRYVITPAGSEALRQLRAFVDELHGELSRTAPGIDHLPCPTRRTGGSE